MSKMIYLLIALCMFDNIFAQQKRADQQPAASAIPGCDQSSASNKSKGVVGVAPAKLSKANTGQQGSTTTAIGTNLEGIVSDLDGNIWVYGSSPESQGFLLRINGDQITTLLAPQMSFVADAFFADAQTGWMLADTTDIYSTIDGGVNWRRAQIENVHNSLRSIYFIDKQNGWAVGWAGLIYHTNDGGLSWQRQAQGLFSKARLEKVTFADAVHGWAIGIDGEILATGDAGQTWRHLNPGGKKQTHIITFINAREGWDLELAPPKINIRRTTDGGKSWAVLRTGSEPLSSLIFFNKKEGMAIGTVILRTTDGGSTWTDQNKVDFSHFVLSPQPKSFVFLNPLRGYAVSRGSIYRTVDGGRTWCQLNEEWRDQVRALKH